MNERIAIIDGIRTPFGKAGGMLKDMTADELGAVVVKEIMARNPLEIDEVIFGNVAQPSDAANVSRVIALKGGLPDRVPAMTVHRNCASGMESITSAASRILIGDSDIILAGGTESMSNIPLLYGRKMTALFADLAKAKTTMQKSSVLLRFRPSFLKPRVGVIEGLTDPICGLVMGLTAENLAREFHITREAQDEFSLRSHQLAANAIESGLFDDEIVPVPVAPAYKVVAKQDEGVRKGQTIEQLQKLRPYFDRVAGTVTVGNSSQLTDGAAAVIVMTESKAKAMGLKPLGYLKAYAYAGLEPHRMGMGPYYATSKLFKRTGMTMKDIDLIEMNEAFAAQILANFVAFEKDLGKINIDRFNVNGGAIALGHPVGTSGTRLVITLLKELRRRNLRRGLASLCVGGGQGAALVLEV